MQHASAFGSSHYDVGAPAARLAKIRAGPPGTVRAEETVFIVKVAKKDKKGHKKIDESSPAFQDYLGRFED